MILKKIIFLFNLVLFVSCINSEKKDNSPHENTEKMHHKHTKHSANEFMHQSSTEELIKRFESNERDEYQNPEKVIAFLGDLSNKTIMDIGAGSGYFSTKLAKHAKKVIAADVNQEFLDYIQKRVESNGLSNIELRKIPYDNPSVEDKEVDIIFMVNTYHHIENRSDYFAKAKKGLAENGELVIIDFFKKETPVGPPVTHKVAKEDIIEELKQAGYNSFDVNVDVLPYQYIITAK